MPGIEDTEQIQYDKINEEQQKNEILAQELKQKIKVVGTRTKRSIALISTVNCVFIENRLHLVRDALKEIAEDQLKSTLVR